MGEGQAGFWPSLTPCQVLCNSKSMSGKPPLELHGNGPDPADLEICALTPSSQRLSLPILRKWLSQALGNSSHWNNRYPGGLRGEFWTPPHISFRQWVWTPCPEGMQCSASYQIAEILTFKLIWEAVNDYFWVQNRWTTQERQHQ